MLRVYTASKLYMAEVWNELRSQLIDIEITASWIDLPEIQKLDQSGNTRTLETAWERNVRDVQRCDVVICYGGPDDILVGALIECGIAIGLGKEVICVGSSKSFGTWIHHENVYHAKSIIDAVNQARKLHG